MSISDEKTLSVASLKDTAAKMVIAARTAPKARGIDTFQILVAEGESVKKLAEKMSITASEYDVQFFERDAGNILDSPFVFLIGTRIQSIGLKKCGMCGFSGCDEKNKYPGVPCVFNTGDLGIALGSAAAVCMDHRVDNRIMYTIGQAAMELGFFEAGIRVAYGIPLSATSKNPFFDRK
jgi:uncharacterized ferredoxin-like protein